MIALFLFVFASIGFAFAGNAPDYVRTREDLARFLESQDMGVIKRKLSGILYECTMENEDPRGPDTGSLRVGRGVVEA